MLDRARLGRFIDTVTCTVRRSAGGEPGVQITDFYSVGTGHFDIIEPYLNEFWSVALY